jgi:hypothetical protein
MLCSRLDIGHPPSTIGHNIGKVDRVRIPQEYTYNVARLHWTVQPLCPLVLSSPFVDVIALEQIGEGFKMGYG